MNDFCHLHTHSEKSILDGYTKVADIPKVAKAQGQSSVAISDHGSLAAILDFYKACKEQEVKGICGVEGYITSDINWKHKDSSTAHIILLAQNLNGLHNLYALSEIAWSDGFYSKPRIDHSLLQKYSDDLICLSACMGGELARSIEKDPTLNESIQVALKYKEIFGDRYYIELQPGNSKELNNNLYTIADDLNIKTVVTVDAHYDVETNKDVQEILLCSQQMSSFKLPQRNRAKKLAPSLSKLNTIEKLNKLWPERRIRYDQLEVFIMSRAEVVERMNQQGHYGNELADMSMEIAERCEQVEFKLNQQYLPKYSKHIDSDEYLRELVFWGLKERNLDKDPIYLERIEEELALISDKQFDDYFLIVYDIINEARKRNIYVGPGRGSAAGSLAAYCLNITAIDPIKYNLLFFRFISAHEFDYSPQFDII